MNTNSMPLTEEQKSDILNRVKKTVIEKHINVANPSQDYAAWAAAVDEQARNLRRSNDDEFEGGVRKLLTVLGSSHTGFYRKNGAIPAPHSIHATLSTAQASGREVWMFLDVVEDGAAFRAGIKPGGLLLSIDGCPVGPPDKPMFRMGTKHRLTIGRLGAADRDSHLWRYAAWQYWTESYCSCARHRSKTIQTPLTVPAERRAPELAIDLEIKTIAAKE